MSLQALDPMHTALCLNLWAKAGCPINRSNEIEGEIAVEGVIFPNPDLAKRKSGEGIPIELFQQGFTCHLLTSETPMEQPLEIRVRAHMAALEAILESHIVR